MDKTLKKIEDYVSELKNTGLPNLDIVFGKQYYSSAFGVSLSDTIELHNIKIRLLTNFDKAIDKTAFFCMTLDNSSDFDFITRDESTKKMRELLNEIFSILEDLYKSDISYITGGAFDYYDQDVVCA